MSFGNPSANERQGGKKKVSEREGRAVDSREGDMDDDDNDNDNDSYNSVTLSYKNYIYTL